MRPSTKQALKPKVDVSDQPIPKKSLMVYLYKTHDQAISDKRKEGWNTARLKRYFDEYLEDLGRYPEWQIDLGYQHWKRYGPFFFPTIGEFINHIEAGRREWISG